jgi:hypothetical protein
MALGLFGRLSESSPRHLPTQSVGPRRRAHEVRCEFAAALRHRAPDLRRCPSASIRSIAAAIKVFADAGWSVDDLVHALDHTPTSRRSTALTADIRQPVRWMTWALRAWLDPDGAPVASRAQRRTAEADARRKAAAKTAARLGERAALRRHYAADPATRAAVATALTAVASKSPRARLVQPGTRSSRTWRPADWPGSDSSPPTPMQGLWRRSPRTCQELSGNAAAPTTQRT